MVGTRHQNFTSDKQFYLPVTGITCDGSVDLPVTGIWWLDTYEDDEATQNPDLRERERD
jgi:hypothetical protein